MGSGHSHVHAVSRDTDERLLGAVLALLLGLLLGEAAVALAIGSLALLADAGHLLVDAGAVGGSLWASRLARRPAGERWTFGLPRAEILAAAVNGVGLLVVAVLIGVEAIQRLVAPVSVDGIPVLVVALCGVAVNIAATVLLARADHSGLNIKGAFAHIVTDLYAFIGTLAAAVVLITTGFNRADSIASLVIVVLMVVAAVPLLRASARVLLEGTPEDVDLDAVREHLLDTAHVQEIHDLHCWTVGTGLPALSAHVVVDPDCFLDGHLPQTLDRLQECLHGHFDIEHSTFQFEPLGHAAHETGSHS